MFASGKFYSFQKRRWKGDVFQVGVRSPSEDNAIGVGKERKNLRFISFLWQDSETFAMGKKTEQHEYD